MASALTIASIPRRRFFAGHLSGQPATSPTEVVRGFAAVQAQDFAGALWALALRTGVPPAGELERLFDDGALARIHVMRPTWHFVDPRDLRWLLTLTAPRVQAGNAGRYRQLELDARTRGRATTIMANAVDGGQFLTRRELGDVLERHKIDTEGQRLAYMVMHAELEQVLCSGPRKGKAFTYAAFDERIPTTRSTSRGVALCELVVRYFSSHGPATLKDFAWWSGLTMADGREGTADAGKRLATAEFDGRTYIYSPGSPDGRLRSPVVHLLPNYDESVASFVDYSPTYGSERQGWSTRNTEVLTRHLVALDGRIVGGWKRTLRAHHVDFDVRLLTRFDAKQHGALDRATHSYAAFLDLERGVVSVDVLA